jgi:hypothetical protein
MEAQGLHVALALDHDHRAAVSGAVQEPEAIENGLAADLPAELVTLGGDAIPMRQLFARHTTIGQPDGRQAHVGDSAQAELAKEGDRQVLELGILLQGES